MRIQRTVGHAYSTNSTCSFTSLGLQPFQGNLQQEVRAINCGVFDISGKPPAMIEWEQIPLESQSWQYAKRHRPACRITARWRCE
ncbi:MAG: hypothetical protein KJ634_04025 [Gammaproteobacteria bacterium]|nr:hypothetical protein [Gammaproteobacteria bacterium]MBU1414772.1 hypothetical protein [Gammaproteobacteria bacterium]